MQIQLNIQLNKPLGMQKNCHHLFQSIIYSLMKGENDTAILHETGEMLGKRTYKLFTFGIDDDQYYLDGNMLVFRNSIRFEVRSIYDDIIIQIRNNAVKNGITVGSHIFRDVTGTITNDHIVDSDVIVHMISPICVYKTDEKKHTHYYNPGEKAFFSAISDNFERKYTAANNEFPEEGISIKPIDVRKEDKYVTQYKGFIIEAYKGTYRLTGKTEYLDFLYQTGLGAKNAQGFGMFRVVG